MRWDDDSSELSSSVSIEVKSGYVRTLVWFRTTPNPRSIDKANESIATTIEARKISRVKKKKKKKKASGSPGCWVGQRLNCQKNKIK